MKRNAIKLAISRLKHFSLQDAANRAINIKSTLLQKSAQYVTFLKHNNEAASYYVQHTFEALNIQFK